MKIWCLFSIENNYDQPSNNLVAWWGSKPGFETVLNAIGGNLSYEASILTAANIIQGKASALRDVEYRLEQHSEGMIS